MAITNELQLPLSMPKTTEGNWTANGGPISHLVSGLFAGIGGLERGLSRAGHETLLLSEIDHSARAVLEKRFPATRIHGDVCTLIELPQETTLVAAGFPCQDLSQAGTTTGIGGTRSGLVGQVLRLVAKHKTPWVLLENVPFMLQLDRGEAMNLLATSFEKLGYCWAYRVIDARSFGLPQRRRRVFFLASLNADPRSVLFADDSVPFEPEVDPQLVACGFYWTEGVRGLGWAVDAVPTLKGGSSIGIPSSPAILLPDKRVVTLDIRDAERLQGFPSEWTKPAETVSKKGSRWKLVGNAVSVPAATWIGKRLARPGEPLDFATVPLARSHSWPAAAWNVGQGRFKVFASERPIQRPSRSLEDFLLYTPPLLSQKATAGFLKRTTQAKLRFPEGFLDAVRAHLKSVSAPAGF